jgi:hypothetical protein
VELERNVNVIDSNLHVDRPKRLIFCQLCSDFTTALPSVLGPCADALNRCRQHASSDAHKACAHAPKRQRMLTDFGVVVAPAAGSDRFARN